MNLEPIIQSEVSQEDKNKYCILMHICGIQKDGTDETMCRAATETDTENRLTDSVQGLQGGKAGMDGRVTQKLTLPYLK